MPTTLPPTEHSGHLAYIGRDGNVYVTTVGGSPRAVTDDATAGPEQVGYSYHRLAWSPQGWLAFAGMVRADREFQSKLYVADVTAGIRQLVGESEDRFVIYLHWSPMPCPGRPDCSRLAYLIEEADSVSLRLVEMSGAGLENRRLGLGQPFYFAWSPDGGQMLWHTGGARRYNDEARLVLYDLEEEQTLDTSEPTGLFLAPAWSPQGNSWLNITAVEKTDQLQLNQGNQTDVLTTITDRHIVFAWSPDGQQIAYALQDGIEPIYGPIHLFDLRTGQTRRLTAPRFRIVSFFWSPQGDRLAYLTKLLPDANQLQWRTYHLNTQEDRGFTAFQPAFQMQFIIGSFNQYAQSHRLWSPDGRYLVYADRDYWLVERVWLVDTWAERNKLPIFIAEGSIGVWSWQ